MLYNINDPDWFEITKLRTILYKIPIVLPGWKQAHGNLYLTPKTIIKVHIVNPTRFVNVVSIAAEAN